jgi:plastocyanin
MRRLTTIIFLLLLGGLIAACGGTDDSAAHSAPNVSATNTPPPTVAAVPDIVISDFAYAVRGPVKAGQQVIIVDKDEASHSVTADAGNAFDVRVSGGGGTSTFTAPSAPGTYAFHCRYHATMHGSLIVQ